MFPEAGGSSCSPGTPSTSSGRSSPPGRRCSTTRSRSRSRRSSCRTTSAGCSGRPLRHSPGRHRLRHRRRHRRWRGQRGRRQGGGRREHRACASPTSSPSCCWSSSALFLVLSPQTLVDNVHLGVAPTWKDFLIAIPVGMIAYTGIETISNMAEEARTRRRRCRRRSTAWSIAVFAIYAALPMVALSALPVTAERRRQVPDAARRARGRRAATPATRAGDRQAPRPRHRSSTPARSTSACSRRRSSSSPPTPGSSACRGWSTRWVCTASCPTGCASCTRGSARRGSGSCCSARSPA